MGKARPPRTAFWLFVVGLGFALGPQCSQPVRIAIDTPLAGAIGVTDQVDVSARAGAVVEEASLAVALEGVDLVAALGLVPPFVDESGTVPVDGDLVAVSGFTITTPPQGPRIVSVRLAGLSSRAWTVEVTGNLDASGAPVLAERDFTLVESLTLEAVDLPAAGRPGGPVPVPPQGSLGNVSLGQALAAPPVSTLGGKTIRSGHVEVAEGLIAGGGS